MALSLRYLQHQSFIGLQVLVGPEGMSHLKVIVGDDGDPAVYSLSTSTDPRFPAEPRAVELSLATVDNATTSPEFTFDAVVGQSLPAGWVTILWLEHDQAAGASFEVDMEVTEAEDAAGSNILGSVMAPADGDFSMSEPSAAQSLEIPLLDGMLPPMGISASDALGRRHYSEYEPSNPLGPFGLPEGPIINANLNDEEIRRLISVGFLSRGRGANAYKLLLTEAGKRASGFPV